MRIGGEVLRLVNKWMPWASSANFWDGKCYVDTSGSAIHSDPDPSIRRAAKKIIKEAHYISPSLSSPRLVYGVAHFVRVYRRKECHWDFIKQCCQVATLLNSTVVNLRNMTNNLLCTPNFTLPLSWAIHWAFIFPGDLKHTKSKPHLTFRPGNLA